MSRTSFNDDDDDDMGTLGSPPTSPRRSGKSWARRVERSCYKTLAHFPLLFVYGLTTWAIWVEVNVSFLGIASWLSYVEAALGVALWALANLSYTIAVFTSPGSPLDERKDLSRSGGKSKVGGYEGLPMHEDEEQEQSIPAGMTLVTAKSTGKPRYCKKCQCLKPDRAHHCSTCGQCVLKMDHHCPWLATCVGLRNYKPFLLFLTYTSTFCWLCFAVSASWVWAEILDETQMEEGLRVVNTILLAMLGGIIGLVLSGFTGWHIYLAMTGQTTIESLEKTRYLSPLRKSMQPQSQRNYVDGSGNEQRGEQSIGDQLKEIHANALPGILRPEEGEDSRDASRTATPAPLQPAAYTASSSPAEDSLQQSFASLEEQRERERYAAYLDELDSEKLPNAFNVGRKRNLQHVFGDNPLFWFLPVCNTSGDGWQWDVSPKWIEARDDVARQRAQRQREESVWDSAGNGAPAPQQRFEPPRRPQDFRWTAGQGFVDKVQNTGAPPPSSRMSPSRQRLNGGNSNSSVDLPMQRLGSRKDSDDTDSYDTSSSDEDVKRMYGHVDMQGVSGPTANWNDVPDDYLAARGRNGGVGRSRSRGRRKGD